MNERIKELMKQADYPAPELALRAHRLAELIVRECAGLFPNVYVEIENEYGHTPVIAADYIKKHFGVEK